MTGATPSEGTPGRDAVPAAVEQLFLMQDRCCSQIRKSVESISSELGGPLDREGRFELAAAVADVGDELQSHYQQKIDAGFFEGFVGTSSHQQERVAHLLSDYRRLLNELRTARHEITAGKPRKAQRQLTSWTGHYSDLMEDESALAMELWKLGGSVK